MTEQITLVPLAKLMPSPSNVRKTAAGEGLDELAASIEVHGLLQNLTVQPCTQGNGKSAGKYEVVAGARRLAALRRLAQQKRIAKGFQVPCRILDGDGAAELSLAENIVRAPLHPADQFEAFAALQSQGLGAEDIAARFGVTATVVLQRLKLAAVSPRLIAEYREDRMTLDQLMAFTITDDHEAQERVWFDGPQYDKHPQAIRRALTRAHVAGNDRRARLIGAEAYEAAGGVILRDLFDAESEGYFTDNALLDRLVAERFDQAAEAVKAEGWSWVEVSPEMDYVYLGRLGRMAPTQTELDSAEAAELDKLAGDYDALANEHGDDPPEVVQRELERLSDAIDARMAARQSWSDEDKVRAGAIICIDSDGCLRIERGLVKPEARAKNQETRTVATESERGDEPRESNPHTDALLEDLTAHRTAGLREALAAQPPIALAALVHALALCTFFGGMRSTCIEVRLVTTDLRAFAAGIAESPAVAAMAARHEQWAKRLPDEAGLWSWLLEQDHDTILDLLAYCTATAANAVQARREGDQRDRIDQANALAAAAGLDMALWWTPTRERYLGRVAKKQILAAVVEGVSAEAAETIAGLKKDAMIVRAEEMLAGKGWLPTPLRPTSPSEPGTA